MSGVAPIFSLTIGGVFVTRSVEEGIDCEAEKPLGPVAELLAEDAHADTETPATPLFISPLKLDVLRKVIFDRDVSLLTVTGRVPGVIGRLLEPDLNKPWPIAFIGVGILLARMDRQQYKDFMATAMGILSSEKVAGRPVSLNERVSAIRISFQNSLKDGIRREIRHS